MVSYSESLHRKCALSAPCSAASLSAVADGCSVVFLRVEMPRIELPTQVTGRAFSVSFFVRALSNSSSPDH